MEELADAQPFLREVVASDGGSAAAAALASACVPSTRLDLAADSTIVIHASDPVDERAEAATAGVALVDRWRYLSTAWRSQPLRRVILVLSTYRPNVVLAPLPSSCQHLLVLVQPSCPLNTLRVLFSQHEPLPIDVIAPHLTHAQVVDRVEVQPVVAVFRPQMPAGTLFFPPRTSGNLHVFYEQGDTRTMVRGDGDVEPRRNPDTFFTPGAMTSPAPTRVKAGKDYYVTPLSQRDMDRNYGMHRDASPRGPNVHLLSPDTERPLRQRLKRPRTDNQPSLQTMVAMDNLRRLLES